MEIFRDWHTRAGVRTQLRRVLAHDAEEGRELFPPELIPYLDHPLIAEVVDTYHEELVTKHLYQYLFYTLHFETSVVNRMTHRLATQPLPVGLAESVRLDALKIYTDEGYHAVFSLDLIDQIHRFTQVEPTPYDFRPYLRHLDSEARRLLPQHPDLAQFMQVVIFETVVSSMLDKIPKSSNVAEVVRMTVRDHAQDERFHHAYFSRVFREVWAPLDNRMKDELALVLPQLILSSVAPNTEPIVNILLSLGVPLESARRVVYETYDERAVVTTTRDAARHTVRLFESEGVTSRPGAEQAFNDALLLGTTRTLGRKL